MHIRSKLILAFFYLVSLVILTAASAGFGLNQVYASFAEIYARNERWVDGTRREVAAAPEEEVKGIVSQRLDDYERGLEAFREAERGIVLTNGIQLGFLVTMGLLTLTFISVSLQRDILSRLFKLKTFCEALLRGQRHLRISMTGNDELTLLGRLLNAALDRQDELQAELRGRLGQQKELVLALLKDSQPEAMLLNAKGDVLVSTLSLEIEAMVREHQGELAKWITTLSGLAPRQLQEGRLIFGARPVAARGEEITGYVVTCALT